jgi:hypothetical protein
LSSGGGKAGNAHGNFSKLLLEKYINYGNSESHKNAFQYFASIILPAVNASITKFDKRK